MHPSSGLPNGRRGEKETKAADEEEADSAGGRAVSEGVEAVGAAEAVLRRASGLSHSRLGPRSPLLPRSRRLNSS